MVTCDTAIDNLKREIIKKVTNKKMMKKLDKKKIPFIITEKNLREKIEDIKRKDFLSALVHFRKIREKSKKGGRTRKGGHWMSWFVYILCRLSEDDSLYDTLWSTCDDDFEELEQAAAEYYNSLSDDAVSPLAAAVSPLAAAVPDVTYTASSISSMTAGQRQEIPPAVVDSWGYDDGRYEAYNGLPGTGLGGGRKKTHRRRKKTHRRRKRKTKKRKRKTKKRKRKSRKRR